MITKEQTWPELQSERPLVIAGPCSAETEDQVLQTALQIHQVCPTAIYRAGIWKPRTRPGNFEGVGAKGLKWLTRVKQEVGLKVTIEVANVKHVYEALKAGIDIFWIGARTTANPFAVQEIAEALRGVDVPVLVKNPINRDLGLWLGAIERMQQVGVERIGAIHRGVTPHHKTQYRNQPEWNMAIELRQEMPGMLLINDPSHIAGKRDLVPKVAQTAMDLSFDGLMIETHINPEHALSDSAQQVTPSHLGSLLAQLVMREETPDGVELETIEELRSSINQIDHQLIDLLASRMEVVKDIANFKEQNQMSIYQESRWQQLLSRNIQMGEEVDLQEGFISKIFHVIHQESLERQDKMLKRP